MKYETPEYQISVIQTNDVLTASNEKYAIEENDNGSGNVIINASNLFV